MRFGNVVKWSDDEGCVPLRRFASSGAAWEFVQWINEELLKRDGFMPRIRAMAKSYVDTDVYGYPRYIGKEISLKKIKNED